MTHRAPLFASFALFVVACATQSADRATEATSPDAVTSSDEAATPDLAPMSAEDSDVFKNNPCGPAAESMCMNDDQAECCTIASIPYQYEMLEGRANADEAAEEFNRSRLEEVLSHGCDLDNEDACVQLERLVQ